ncbi:hypothetical protein ID866_6899 [Astraeus odoratus]|nr:hypothetical protein ID866_6899 [Astraeus odoratus]
MNPERIREQFKRIDRLRVLVVGRSNAGKTTILQRVCNTTDLPEVFNGKGIDSDVVKGSLERGHHNIRDELVFQSNRLFIFHHSCGFEAGSEDEFEKMKEFVAECSSTLKLAQRIHAIWYCIPMDDYERPITAAEEKFFNECDTGSVPVIVLLTKSDSLNLFAIGHLRDEGYDIKEAKARACDIAKKLLIDMEESVAKQLHQCKFAPKFYLPLSRMNDIGSGDECTRLITCTADALDNNALQKLLISTQQNNLSLNIQYALQKWVYVTMQLIVKL